LGEVLEGLAEALYLEREYAASAACYERTYTAYRREHQNMAAGRAARTLAWITGNVLGDWAVRSGWLARARTILGEAGEDGPEHGWVLIISAFSEPDAQVRETLLREAIAIGRRFGDPDIEFLALAYLGGLLVMTDRVEEGLVLSDEALAALCAGELTELATVDEIFCGLFWACELVKDVPRADQWMRVATDRMQRSNVDAAFCRAHYGGSSRRPDAGGRRRSSCCWLPGTSTRGCRRGAAIIRLADLRVRQGRLEAAAQLLKGLEQHPDVVPTRLPLSTWPAARWRSRGICWNGPPTARTTRFPRSVSRPWRDRCWHSSSTSIWKQGASTTPAGPPDAWPAGAQRAPYLRAVAALAEGRVCVASGQGDARACLHEALQGFARAQLPMELARTRLELARALAERSPEVAIAEAKAALEGFQRLQAARHADAAAALLRSLGAPSGPASRAWAG
jgi:hypothetical protein